MKENVKKLTFSAMFLALGLVLPLLTGQIQQIGNMLLPMHIPVLLCGLICGPVWGLIVGLILPLLRSVTFGMPPMYPTAIAMAFELAAYGGLIGWLYRISRWKCVKALYRCLILAMIMGRLVWGIAMVILMGISGNAFTFQAFLAGSVLNSIPGIILQLILIPAIMMILDKTSLVPFTHREKSVEYAKRR